MAISGLAFVVVAVVAIVGFTVVGNRPRSEFRDDDMAWDMPAENEPSDLESLPLEEPADLEWVAPEEPAFERSDLASVAPDEPALETSDLESSSAEAPFSPPTEAPASPPVDAPTVDSTPSPPSPPGDGSGRRLSGSVATPTNTPTATPTGTSTDTSTETAPHSVDAPADSSLVAQAPATSPPESTTGFGPSVPFDEQPEYSPSAASLSYDWASREPQFFKFSYEADLKTETSVIEGTVSYQGTDIDPATVVDADTTDERDREGNGTGFVIRPDGYLVTCAHVVEGATELNVELNGETYAGKVVAFDSAHDLAVVRIDAKDLTYLPLANSDAVRLAEEVRAFGFPMTNVLGESIKITRGTIAGIIEQDGSKTFQLDATVNPGNSGGPFVNAKGHVVGVARAIMAGDRIAPMSFGVVSNDVARLMERHEWKFQRAMESDAVLSGPDLADRVRRGVALIKVKVGPGGAGFGNKTVVKYRAEWAKFKRRGTARLSTSRKWENGTLVVDPIGEVIHNSGASSLPSYLGPIGQVGVERLPNDDRSRRWETNRILVIPKLPTVHVNQSPLLTPPSRRYSPFHRFPRSRLFGRPQTTVAAVDLQPALERVRYELTGGKGDTVTIRKRYELITLSKKDQPPSTKVTGDGTIEFDKKKRRSVSMEFKGILSIRVDGTIADIPIRLRHSAHDQPPRLAAQNGPPDSASRPPPETPPSQPRQVTGSPATPTAPTRPAGNPVRPSTPPRLPPRPLTRATGGQSEAPVAAFGLTELDLSLPADAP